MTRARYKFSADKAVEAIHYMASRQGTVDLHTALKACYFADKSHLNEHLQPIFGATYRAMKYGPVPLEIYEIIKSEGLWLWETDRDEFPWKLDGYRISASEPGPQQLLTFSDSEREHFERGFETSRSMSFTARTAATHGADWQSADGGLMKYEDMIAERDDREQVVEYLKETARHVRL